MKTKAEIDREYMHLVALLGDLTMQKVKVEREIANLVFKINNLTTDWEKADKKDRIALSHLDVPLNDYRDK